MRTVTAAQMREADRRCIEDLGMPGVVLMNTAGVAVFNEVRKGPVGVVCGKGNNGGDGFVVARLALLAGMEVRVVLVARPEEITGDAAVFMGVYRNMGGTILSVCDEAAAAQAVGALRDCAVVVDALLGTGTRGEVRGAMGAAIAAWPPVYTVSVDLPSGLNADTGEVCGVCVKADVTVSFACGKQGFTAAGAKAYLGKVLIADIGIPEWCVDDDAWARKKPGP